MQQVHGSIIYRMFVSFQNIPLYIFGQSYGGKMAVVFAEYIYEVGICILCGRSQVICDQDFNSSRGAIHDSVKDKDYRIWDNQEMGKAP